jgi:hypothetical protein
MSDVQLFQTRMGQQFYDGTMPKIAAALDRIATALEGQAASGAALDAIAARLSGREWTPDDLDAIAAVVRATGRSVHNPSDAENV